VTTCVVPGLSPELLLWQAANIKVKVSVNTIKICLLFILIKYLYFRIFLSC
jgi:hypothetical protein